MKKVILYSHGGSKNHGCEAIVRSTVKIINKDDITLYSLNKEEDLLYGINNIVNVKNAKSRLRKYNPKNIVASLKIRILKDSNYSEKLPYSQMFKENKNNAIAISIGGDNYCYSDNELYGILNKEFNKNNVKTVLWGCSVEPDIIKGKIAEDLSRYSLITARETISYEALKKVNNNTKLYPDPAFQLDKVDLPLPKGFDPINTIGINLSPLIMKCESKDGATINNYKSLIEYIIKKTDMKIALIPHVVWDHNNDKKPLKELFEMFKDTGRVIIIDDYNCMELKGFISRCRIFIGARTHATIAAYSTCIPTLVIGYSVKAKGIAKDIFGTYENYVLPVQSLQNKDDLINAFKWIMDNEDNIKKHLIDFMPSYINKSLEARKEIENLINIYEE